MLLEKDWKLNKTQNVFIQAGFNLRFSFGYDSDSYGYGNVFTDANQQRIDVFSMELNSNNHNKPWISYNLGCGYGWTLKNNNVFKAGIIANISFTKFVNGTYQVNIPGHPLTEGTYRISGSYIGISLSYVFMRASKYKL